MAAQGEAAGPDYVALNGEMKILSAVIDESMAQIFGPPFGVLEKTRGTYLPGYGIVLALEVNLYPIPMHSLMVPHPVSKAQQEQELKTKKERIKFIEQGVPRLLSDHAGGLRDIKADDQIAVVVHLFFVEGDQQGLPSQIVIQVGNHDLTQFLNKKMSYKDLLKQVRITEY